MSLPTPDYPLHRLNTPQTKLWLISKPGRKAIAAALVKSRYRGGFGVCAATLRLIALVDPRGVIRELPPPHKQYEMWQVANQPAAIIECPCADYYDPEVGGRFGERGTSAGHHPFCQFERTANRVFKEAQGRAARRLNLDFEHGTPLAPVAGARGSEGVSAQARPDEWEQLRREYRGR